ncbi:hypothetical protein CEP51_002282 [Fusarium floridanum]|uniref:Protein kinase domain-containing protein n=1 Tax=Fusarium floridanum TaxID=1325733 RepID=A0A428SBZ2_9HYPO|nr:hypothetical protein CEP51_002282 [Fusarium floridanum]
MTIIANVTPVDETPANYGSIPLTPHLASLSSPFVGKSKAQLDSLVSQDARLRAEQGKEVHVIKKKLKSKEMTKAVQHERMCLRLLNQLQHPNIIRLLGSYTYRGDHNFLFPCLDMDLEAFLQRDDRYGQFEHDITFFEALRGLSSALSKTHQLHLSQECHGVDFEAIGYHHDLRPKNVLVSKETLVLADFGLGNLKTAEDQSMTTWKPTTGDYLAPECMDSKMRRQDVNRAIDVWAFGCLVAEMVTYMTKGAKGVKEFRARRLTPGRASGWSDSGFYHPDGHVKDEVTAWLDGITQDCLDKSLLPSLVKLLLMALAKAPTHRPKISSICQTLTFLSLKAHFSAVHQQLLDLEGQESQHESRRANIWFLRQRLCAWGLVLALDKDSASVDLTAFLDQLYDQAIVKMVTLFHMLKGSPEGQLLADADARSIIEPEIDQLVEDLWNLLPTKVRGQAEDYWHQAVLSTDSPDEIEGVYNTLKSRYTAYDIAGAMALMKKFQLGTLHPGSIQSVEKPCRLSWDDIKLNSSSGAGHVFGRHRDQKPVLVEEFTFTSHRVELTQRTLVLDLKAKSLSVDPKPEGLRTLKCLGALEANSSRGYGLVFEYPEGEESTPTTLLQYLILGEKSTRGHPFLGNRFKLAFSLADFFKEFHAIGWMHEAFNARNVLFFQPLDASGRRTLQLENPYIALRIDFVPVSWDRGRTIIGSGATSKVQEAFINRNTGFAFKRANQSKTDAETYKALVNEIMVLSHPLIRNHPNISQLQGFCWEVSEEDDKSWPVLIFEKAPFGDLLDFSRLREGTEISFAERLELCVDIGTAILDLHLNGIIHGDIKPENVLVFKEDGTYGARVIDFGYSTLYADNHRCIKLPISYPWNAPENNRQSKEWTLLDAKRADTFSFSMVCLWFFFQPYFSGSKPLPPSISNLIMEEFAPEQEQSPLHDIHVLDTLKVSNEKLLLLSCQLLAAEHSLDDSKRDILQVFFRTSLSRHPEDREASLGTFIENFGTHRLPSGCLETAMQQIGAADFKLLESLTDFYRCDYRVRSHIFQRLVELHSIDPTSVAEQLATCHYIGFGSPRDDVKLAETLPGDQQATQRIRAAFSERTRLQPPGLNEPTDPDEPDDMDEGRDKFRATTLSGLFERGLFRPPSMSMIYYGKKNSEAAIERLLKEAKDLNHIAEPGDELVNALHLQVICIYIDLGRSEEAEQLCLELLETNEKARREGDFETLEIMKTLSQMYQDQGQWQKSEEIVLRQISIIKRRRIRRQSLERSLVDLAALYVHQGRYQAALKIQLRQRLVNERLLGEEHRDTQESTSQLAFTYWASGQWHEAEELMLTVVDVCKKLYGEEHPETLDRILFLARVQIDQHRWKESDVLCTSAVPASRRVLGEEHPVTLRLTEYLATARLNQGHLEEAQNMAVSLVETSIRIHDTDILKTGEHITVLASVRSKQRRWADAEVLFAGVLEEFRSAFGRKHRDTLRAMANLAGLYLDSGRLSEAEERYTELLRLQKKVLADDHPETLRTMANLAEIYLEQEDWEKAAVTYNEVILANERVDEDSPARGLYGLKIVQALRGLGEDEEADEVEKLLS